MVFSASLVYHHIIVVVLTMVRSSPKKYLPLNQLPADVAAVGRVDDSMSSVREVIAGELLTERRIRR